MPSIDDKVIGYRLTPEELLVDKLLDQKVRMLIGLPLTDKPDSDFRVRDVVARNVIVEGYDDAPSYSGFGKRVGIKLRVNPNCDKSNGLYHTTFTASYNDSLAGMWNYETLKKFIDLNIGHLVRIAYNLTCDKSFRPTALQMILPYEGALLYVKGAKRKNEGLVPYVLISPHVLKI